MAQVEVCGASADKVQSLIEEHGELLYGLSKEGSVRIFGPDETFEEPRSGRFRSEDVVRESLRSLVPGLVVVADEQSEGRGRHGSEWVSPEGCLTCSIGVVLPRAKADLLPFLQYVAALSVVDAVRSTEMGSQVPLQVKWPNDVLINGDKVAGILCEGIVVEGNMYVSVGIGINVTNENPTCSLKGNLPASATISREVVLAALINSFEPLFEVLKRDGFEPLKQRYYDRWIHTDQVVSLENREGKKARILGLAESGSILLQLIDSGEEEELDPYSASLDLNASTVRVKSTS
ncbi:hypothetical protein NDN08_005791 [Rhodosorus marinus]|uniref:BPL/LPL catalytic domain-containing protein n=1 Tax=Rhodosorus marinus TaxID=101924 RepID=A0AAV8V2L7_9RHOD|nr:hypothetical protein NDN08_005791 [Rhodosorus marinus]